jgi:hypothetical protein
MKNFFSQINASISQPVKNAIQYPRGIIKNLNKYNRKIMFALLATVSGQTYAQNTNTQVELWEEDSKQTPTLVQNFLDNQNRDSK